MVLVLLGVAVFLFLLVTLLIEGERWGMATVALLVSAGAYFWFNKSGVVELLTQHWVQLIVFAAIYLVVGVAWSFIKWFSFLISFRDRLRDLKREFLEHKVEELKNMGQVPTLDVMGEVPLELIPDLKSFISNSRYSFGWVKNNYHGNSLIKKPQVAENKGRIVAWMSFWPFSLLGTMINDPVRRLFNWLYNQFKFLYQRMSDHIFRNEELLK